MMQALQNRYTRVSQLLSGSSAYAIPTETPEKKQVNVIQQTGEGLMTDLATLKHKLESPQTSEGREKALHHAQQSLGESFSPKMIILALLAYIPTAEAACTDSTVAHDGTTYSFTGAAIDKMLESIPTTSATKFHDDLMATFPGYNQAYMAVTTSHTFENYCSPDESTLPQQMAAAFNTLFSMGSSSDQTTAATLLPTHSLLPPYNGATTYSCSPVTPRQCGTLCSQFSDAKADLLGVDSNTVEDVVYADTQFPTTGTCPQAEVVDPVVDPNTNTTNPNNGSTPAPTPTPDSYTWMDWAQFAGAVVVTGAVLGGVGYCIYNACQSTTNPHLKTLGLRDEDVTPTIQDAVNGIPGTNVINNEDVISNLSVAMKTFVAENGDVNPPLEELTPIINGFIDEFYNGIDDEEKALLHDALITCFENYRDTGVAQKSFAPGDIKRECLRLLFNKDSDRFNPEIVTSLWALTAKKRLFDAHIGLKPEDLSIRERFIQNRALSSVDTESNLGQKRTTTIPDWVITDRENSADVLTTHILRTFDLGGSTHKTERTSLKETINTAMIGVTTSIKGALPRDAKTDQDVMFTIITPPELIAPNQPVEHDPELGAVAIIVDD